MTVLRHPHLIITALKIKLKNVSKLFEVEAGNKKNIMLLKKKRRRNIVLGDDEKKGHSVCHIGPENGWYENGGYVVAKWLSPLV